MLTDSKKEWFQDLGGLRTLNLSRNKLTETTDEDFENLHSLEVFDLSQNNLEQVGKSVFDSFRSAIEELYLNENDFASLENDVFCEMWSLKVIVCPRLFHMEKLKIVNFKSIENLETKEIRVVLGNNRDCSVHDFF